MVREDCGQAVISARLLLVPLKCPQHRRVEVESGKTWAHVRENSDTDRTSPEEKFPKTTERYCRSGDAGESLTCLGHWSEFGCVCDNDMVFKLVTYRYFGFIFIYCSLVSVHFDPVVDKFQSRVEFWLLNVSFLGVHNRRTQIQRNSGSPHLLVVHNQRYVLLALPRATNESKILIIFLARPLHKTVSF